MKVSLLEISNFRGVQHGLVQFREHTVLVGPNSSGKTTVLEALALVLGRDRLIRNLTEHDFFGSDPAPESRIKIVATITGFEPQDSAEHVDWFRDGRGVPFWFDAHSGTLHPERTEDHQELACQIVFSAYFNRESLEVETARYFNDDDDIDVFDESVTVNVPGRLIREIGFFFVPASRTWDRMISFSSELFRRVIRSADGLPAASILSERDKVRNPPERLEDDKRLKPLIEEVNNEIVELFGAPTPLMLRITNTDSLGVLDAIVPHFQSAGGISVPSKREGSGLVSMQSLLLLLHFGQKRIKDGESFFLAMEEPELHLPPAIQNRVLSRLQSLSSQTIVTTHSPLIASYCDATSLLIIRNDGGKLSSKPLLERPLDRAEINAVRKLFQINRIETVIAMMSEFILVPEGRIDYEWLSLLERVLALSGDGERNTFGVRIGVVPTGDSKVQETCAALSNAHPSIVAIVDGDNPGLGYAKNLDVENSPVKLVLRWPNEWTIENVIEWIVEADEAAVLERFNAELEEPIDDTARLTAMLKAKPKEGGFKGDRVGYEMLASAISESEPCRARIRTLLQSITDACCNTDTPSFVLDDPPGQLVQRLVFNP